MPGIFGAVGFAPEVYEQLSRKFAEPWGSSEVAALAGGIIGGHAFPPHRALYVCRDGIAFAVDGEVSAYLNAGKSADQGPRLFELSSGRLTLSLECKGNVALVDSNSGLWYLATEWSGTFPLYYLLADTGLVFCSRQRPVAKLLGLGLDPLGLVEFLRYAYTFAGRTSFEGLKRLLPGQVLTYDPSGKKFTLCEASKAWARDQREEFERDVVADRCWHTLLEAVKRSMPGHLRHAVMLSGGWDSRSLLASAAVHVPRDRLLGYSHGDLNGRELQIARNVCKALSLPFRAEPLDDRAFDLELLNRGFSCMENVSYPYWHRAGMVLSEAGIDCVSAGLHGEILGGQYSLSNLFHGAAKAAAVARILLGLPAKERTIKSSNHRVLDFFRVGKLTKPWYLSREFWEAIHKPAEAMNGDIEKDFSRLLARGVLEPDKLVEAFQTEHKASHQFISQILSCRARMDIAIPFIDREYLFLVSQIPIEMRIHNSLNRLMLRRHARRLLEFPCAAMLVPASSPVLLQEVSRVFRNAIEDGRWAIHFKTGGIVSPPRFSWMNSEFLRTCQSFRLIEGDLRCPLWDQEAIGRRISDILQGRWQRRLDDIADVMMRFYTVDLTLR